MTIVVNVTDEQRQELEERARPLGLTVEALIEAAVADLLARPEPDFEKAATAVLAKNAALYKRLS